MKNDIQLSEHLTSSSALTLSHSNKLDDLRLTEHFKLSEFTRSATATARKIDNTPSQEVISNLKALCQNVLEPLRAYANESSPSKGDKRGSVPIIIGSGYRSPALNKAVGGVKNSQHMTGEAADIRLPRTPYIDWGDNLAHTDMSVAYRWLDFLEHHTDFDQLILEHSHGEYWIHVSCRANKRKNRHQVIHFMQKK